MGERRKAPQHADAKDDNPTCRTRWKCAERSPVRQRPANSGAAAGRGLAIKIITRSTCAPPPAPMSSMRTTARRKTRLRAAACVQPAHPGEIESRRVRFAVRAVRRRHVLQRYDTERSPRAPLGSGRRSARSVTRAIAEEFRLSSVVRGAASSVASRHRGAGQPKGMIQIGITRESASLRTVEDAARFSIDRWLRSPRRADRIQFGPHAKQPYESFTRRPLPASMSASCAST